MSDNLLERMKKEWERLKNLHILEYIKKDPDGKNNSINEKFDELVDYATNNRYEGLLQGNIEIKKRNQYNYKIIFETKPKITFFQVWNEFNGISNRCRNIFQVKPKEFINVFNVEKNFEPTGYVIINNETYFFVVKKVYCCHKKFMIDVSIKEIKQSKKLPVGIFSNSSIFIDSFFGKIGHFFTHTVPHFVTKTVPKAIASQTGQEVIKTGVAVTTDPASVGGGIVNTALQAGYWGAFCKKYSSNPTKCLGNRLSSSFMNGVIGSSVVGSISKVANSILGNTNDPSISSKIDSEALSEGKSIFSGFFGVL